MEHSLSQHTKECLTTIVKYILFSLILITNLTCNKMNKQNFKVFGEDDLLRNTKINIVETGETGEKIEKTFLFKGEKYDVEAEVETGGVYEVYVSYKDSLVNVLKFENVMRNANDYINHLYLTNTDNKINILYVGRESDIAKKKGFNVFLIALDEYYKIHDITSDNEIKENNILLFEKF